jgi:protein-tyrosine kinase
MSRYLNEIQKANPRSQSQTDGEDVDIRRVLESLKEVAPLFTKVPDVGIKESVRVEIQTGNNAPLILRNDTSSQAALEAYRGLRTRLMRIQSKSVLRTIAITSTVPGEGKTLTVMNLGLCYSQLADQRILIVDGDLRTRGLTQLLGNPDTMGLAEVLSGKITAEEAVLSTNQKNLFVMPAGIVASPAPEHFTGERWQEFLGWCSTTFQVVLVDTPPVLPLADFELISAACDGIVAVVRAHHAERDLLQKTASALDPKKLIGVVFNATDVKSASYNYDYAYRQSNSLPVARG